MGTFLNSPKPVGDAVPQHRPPILLRPLLDVARDDRLDLRPARLHPRPRLGADLHPYRGSRATRGAAIENNGLFSPLFLGDRGRGAGGVRAHSRWASIWSSISRTVLTSSDRGASRCPGRSPSP